MATQSTTPFGAVDARAIISPELAQLFEAVERTKAEADRYTIEVFDPLREQWLAARAAVPHFTFKGPENYDGGSPIWSTEQDHRVRHATWAIGQRCSFHGPGSDAARKYYNAQRRLVRGAQRRIAKLDEITRALDFDAVGGEVDRLDQLFFDAIDAVLAFPVTSLTDLAAKLDFMIREGQFENDSTREIMQRDVSSLQQKEA